MLSIIFDVISPVLLCVLVGYGWARSRSPFDHQFVTRLVTYIGAPCLIVATINNAELATGLFWQVAQWSLLLMLGFALLGWVVFKFLGMNYRTLSLAVVFPNTGNLGLPLSLFAFGEEGLLLALIIFVTISLVQFGCGDLVLSEEKSTARRLKNLASEPIFLASVIALILILTGWKLPNPLYLGLNLLGGMTIPLMLVMLGVTLANMENLSWRQGWLISLLRVPGGFLVALAVVKLFSLTGLVAQVLILQAAMPSAVFNYFFALRHGKEQDTVAAGVVLSTTLSFLTLPLLLWFLFEFQ